MRRIGVKEEATKVVEDFEKQMLDAIKVGAAKRNCSMEQTADDITYNTVTVTFGKETFSPIQFYSFEVGPFSATTQVLEGETLDQAVVRARIRLEAIHKEEFESKLRGHIERAAKAISAVRGGR